MVWVYITLDLKIKTIGFEIEGNKYAIKADDFTRKGEYEILLSKYAVVLETDKFGNLLAIKSRGDQIQFIESFWFAWYLFNPETKLFVVDEDEGW